MNQKRKKKENNFSPRMPYPAKLSFKIDGGIKVFHNKQKLNQYMITKPPLQKTLRGILHTEDESKQNQERMGSIKLQEKKKNNNQRVALIRLHTLKSLNNKNN
jgi:hypothetical protein